MSKRYVPVLAALVLWGVVPAIPAQTTSGTATSRSPNIVLMLADDFGYSDLACYGSTFHETPHLDALARQGVRFTDAYAAAPICSPSRAAILSGKFPARFALTHYIHKQDSPKAKRKEEKRKLKPARFEEFMPLEEVTVAETLKANGYKTFVAGKWHLGEYDKYGPEKQGFDVAIGTRIGGHTDKYFSPYGAPGLADGPDGEYLTDRLSSETVTFIRQNRDKPFFIYHAFYAVHTPIQGKPELVERYEKKREAAGLKHETVMEGPHKVKDNQSDPAYAAMVHSMDEAAGNIISTIKEFALERDTLIIFTSDNGGLATNGKEGGPTTNKPLRTGKGWMYEGGLRVPLIAAWPGTVTTDQVTSAVVSGPDIYPTILDAAGVAPLPEQHVDGRSFLPVLKGETPANPDRPIFWHFPHYGNQNGTPGSAVRAGKWKLIKWYEGNRLELFDLHADKEERHDLAEKHPEIVRTLAKQLDDWLASINARLPQEKPAAGK